MTSAVADLTGPHGHGLTTEIVERLSMGLAQTPGRRADLPHPRAQAGSETVELIRAVLQFEHEVPEALLVDAAAAAARLSRAALLWQAQLTRTLARRRTDAAAANLFDNLIADRIGDGHSPIAAEELVAHAGADVDRAAAGPDHISAVEVENFDIESRDLARRAAIAECAVASGTTESVLAAHVHLLDGVAADPDHPHRYTALVTAVECGRIAMGHAAAIVDAITPVTAPSVAGHVARQGIAAAEQGMTLPKLRRLLDDLVGTGPAGSRGAVAAPTVPGSTSITWSPGSRAARPARRI